MPEGLSAVFLPDLGPRNRYGDAQLPTETQALSNLNSFLQELNRQRADIVSILDVSVYKPPRPGVMSGEGPKKLVIVRKKTE